MLRRMLLVIKFKVVSLMLVNWVTVVTSGANCLASTRPGMHLTCRVQRHQNRGQGKGCIRSTGGLCFTVRAAERMLAEKTSFALTSSTCVLSNILVPFVHKSFLLPNFWRNTNWKITKMGNNGWCGARYGSPVTFCHVLLSICFCFFQKIYLVVFFLNVSV